MTQPVLLNSIPPETSDDPFGGPTYVPGAHPGEYWAHFATGTSVRAGKSRARRYPNLRGDAPCTLPFYRQLLVLSSDVEVVDAGAGSGIGTKLLSEHFDKVTGCEADPTAIAFAREYCPRAKWVTALRTAGSADVAVVADVLGHAARPGAFLRELGAVLRPDGAVFVAEPSAEGARTLLTPQRRAFTPRSLAALLLRSGFSVSRWVGESGTFIACWARPLAGAAATALARAAEAYERGDLDSAVAALADCTCKADPVLYHERLLLEAEIALARGDGDAAVTALLHARDIQPEEGRSLAALSEIALAMGEADEALRLALEARRADVYEPRASRALARAALSLSHAEVLGALQLAYEQAPADLELAIELARCQADRGDCAAATATLERYRNHGDEVDARFHVTLAWLLHASGRVGDARIEARLARLRDPNDPDVAELWQTLFGAS